MIFLTMRLICTEYIISGNGLKPKRRLANLTQAVIHVFAGKFKGIYFPKVASPHGNGIFFYRQDLFLVNCGYGLSCERSQHIELVLIFQNFLANDSCLNLRKGCALDQKSQIPIIQMATI
ncbi:hypothetical protein EJ02DRAFT_70285 [Clathrospora elynae]|uniref:Uncharacterized protein n=1 Tax=Clathrospora elynae TaxID=706981 RepID=A0A6A5SA22_9PLEO|nr:hypothetical protein EJ02DRAFT_70285 [Clathrospora elynae]